MSEVKERILGAITMMSDNEAGNVWEYIMSNLVAWKNISAEQPDNIDLQMLKDIENDKDCQEFVPFDEAMRQLGV